MNCEILVSVARYNSRITTLTAEEKTRKTGLVNMSKELLAREGRVSRNIGNNLLESNAGRNGGCLWKSCGVM
jgi:hypothetical protein